MRSRLGFWNEPRRLASDGRVLTAGGAYLRIIRYCAKQSLVMDDAM